MNILTGQLRRRGRRAVPAPGDRHALVHRPASWSGTHRSVAHAGARRARGARPGPAVVPRRGDRHPGRGPDQGPHHHRRQPGAVGARRRAARRRAADARRHDQHRQLPERDHAARPRDPARTVVRWSSRTATRRSGASPCVPWPGGRRRSSMPGDRPAEWEILLRLGAILGGHAGRRRRRRRRSTTSWFIARAARHGVDGERGRHGRPARAGPHRRPHPPDGPWGDRLRRAIRTASPSNA